MRLRFATAFSLSLAIIGALLAFFWISAPQPADSPAVKATSESLLLYCAAGLQPPISEIAKQFEGVDGARIQTRYGGSGALLSEIRIAGGDLFLAADRQYLATAEQLRLTDRIIPVASQSPILVVAKGNPKHIQDLPHLLRPDVRLSLADPRIAAIGKVVEGLLNQDGTWQKLYAKAFVHRDTVNQVANDVKLDAADAGIVWDAMAPQYPDLDFIRLPKFERSQNEIAVALLSTCKHKELAERFLRYLTSPKDGLAVFRNHGYRVIERPARSAEADPPKKAAPAGKAD